MIRQEFLGDKVVWVALADLSQYGLMVDIGGVGTGTAFEMMGYTSCGYEAFLAERAGDIRAAVYGRVQMLSEVILILETPLAARAPMLPPVVLCVHMLPCLVGSVKTPIARLALVFRCPVSFVVHMFLSCFFSPKLVVTHLTCPVTDCVHVLPSSLHVDERA